MNKKYYLKYIQTLLYPYRYRLFGIILLMLLTAAGNIIIPLLQQKLIDEGIVVQDWRRLLILLSLTVVCYILISLLSYAIYKVQTNISSDFSRTMQIKSMRHLIRLKKENLDNEGVIKLSKDADYCIETIMTITDNTVSQIFIEGFKFIGIIIAIFTINWKMALLIFSFIPIRLFLNTIIGLQIGKYSKENISCHQTMHKWEEDVYTTMQEIKLWNLYEKKDQEYDELISPITNVLKKISLLQAKDSQIGDVAGKIVFCLIYLFAAQMIWGNTLSIGGLLIVISYFTYILTPVALFAALNSMFQRLMPAIDKFENYMELEEEKFDSSNSFIESSEKGEPFIKIDSVCFSYGERNILNRISCSILKGETVALVGDNGAGKSTLLDIILRFKEPLEGDIKINGNSINKYELINYREMFGVVSQLPNLFDATVTDNVTLFGTFETNKQVLELPLFSFINNFSNGINSDVGSKSTKLSGGEKQKIAFARVLMKNPMIMILDEPTSNYDKESKEDFLKLLPELKCTTIIISHDSDILRQVKKIILLEQGKLHVFNDFVSYSHSEYYNFFKEDGR